MPGRPNSRVGEDLPHQEYSRGITNASYPMTLRGAEKLREELDFLKSVAVLKSLLLSRKRVSMAT